jgi:hypothetical protein
MEIEGLRRASEAVQSIVERIGYDGIARQISIRFHAGGRTGGPRVRVQIDVTYARDSGAGRPCQRELPGRKAADLSIPRIARLMALTIRFEELLRNETIRDSAELAEPRLKSSTPRRQHC